MSDLSLGLARLLQEVPEVEQSDDMKHVQTIWVVGWVVIAVCSFFAFVSIQLLLLMGIIICCRKLR